MYVILVITQICMTNDYSALDKSLLSIDTKSSKHEYVDSLCLVTILIYMAIAIRYFMAVSYQSRYFHPVAKGFY
jgi:hypothetical protein